MLSFHPAISRWFENRFAEPTPPQRQGWPPILARHNTLIAAPTGSGKTLAAFLAVIDRLLRNPSDGTGTRVVYVSPLRALSNDMHANLEVPLRGIFAELTTRTGNANPPPNIRVGLRTGDTSSSERARLVKHPPEILVTTPESLYLLLTSERGRTALRTVDTLIVDEIHAMIGDKRGAHLALTMERLEALCGRLQRIGISATQKPIDRVADFLVGNRDATCEVVDVGHSRELDLAIELPETDLAAVCTLDHWEEVYRRLVELIESHTSTLVFVNTRRLAERVTHRLCERLGDEQVGSHHGSMSAERRHRTERKLKSGQLRAVVATASLELGLDVGTIDLVIQLGSPRSIATFLQRTGRSGHSLSLTPKGRLFALTRDELLECLALQRAIRQGQLDTFYIPEHPLDVLAQQIVAEVATGAVDVDELFGLVRRATPYARLTREDFTEVLEFLSEGMTRRSAAYLHYDRVGRRLRARPGARIVATTNGGAIPEVDSFRVVSDPDETLIGSLDEDFALESAPGDIFLLGNTSWRILSVRGTVVRVADAHGAPPTIPFWRGEAPGRTAELSQAVSDLRSEIETRLARRDSVVSWLSEATGSTEHAAGQAVDYCRAQIAAIGVLPTQQRVVFERFFDESGGMQLVVHAPFGGALNRAWGLAMRKRFCRSFDFELQATADDNGFLLSLGPQHSFELDSMFALLNAENVSTMLEQAVLAIPLFQIRWRWNVTRALMVLRRRNGKKIPPALQRFRSDDLLTSVFPTITGCLENVVGDIELPDHPLVRQTMHDCLHEALDLGGLIEVLENVAVGDVEFVARDTREPSPFSHLLLNANPYAFLDGGELAERRARAVTTRRSLDVESLRDLAELDPIAIEDVCAEAQPLVRNADELHDVLYSRFVVDASELSNEWTTALEQLRRTGRAMSFVDATGTTRWFATERLPAVVAVWPGPFIDWNVNAIVPDGVRMDWTAIDARLAIVRGLMEVCGPITANQAANRLGLTVAQTSAALEALEGEGGVLRGRFRRQDDTEWCDRRLLARIHRRTLNQLRREIEPVDIHTFQRFLFHHHGIGSAGATGQRGVNGLYATIGMLQGVDIAACCWEREVLPPRLQDYNGDQLDELCRTGEVSWGRIGRPSLETLRRREVNRAIPVSVFLRSDLPWLTAFTNELDIQSLSEPARSVFDALQAHGATFAMELPQTASMTRSNLDAAIGELIAVGLVTADGFAGLRDWSRQSRSVAEGWGTRRWSRGSLRQRSGNPHAGRWSLWRPAQPTEQSPEFREEALVQWAWQLVRRWGIVFRDLLDREVNAPRWSELVHVFRRLEAQGELRGGRFVRGVSGEQYATDAAARNLRNRRTQVDDNVVIIAAADPLNLTGVIDDERIAATSTNRIAYRNGRPVAAWQNQEVRWLAEIPDAADEIATWLRTGDVGHRSAVRLPSNQMTFEKGG